MAGLPKRSSTTSRYAGEVDRSWMLRRRQAGDDVVGDVVVRDLPHRGIARAFVNELVADQRAGPGDRAVAGIQDADLGFLVRIDGVDHLHTDLLPRRPAVAEVVLDHPLNEALAHHRRGVVPAGGRLDALRDIGRRDAA